MSKRIPRRSFTAEKLPYKEPRDTNKLRPKFCLEHILADYDIKGNEDKEQKAAFAEQLQTLAALTWSEIQLSHRHGVGQEQIAVRSLKINLPPFFGDEEKVIALRYKGKLPILGIRVQEVFHVIAVARNFNELYEH